MTVTILRLTNSDDTAGPIPDERRSYRVAERMVAAATGEPVETVRKVIWPAPALPDLVSGWVERYQPDLVFLLTSSYWVSHESAYMKLRQQLGPIMEPLARVGTPLVYRDWFTHSWPYRGARRLALRTIGGAPLFPPEFIIELMEECVRRILRYERAGLVVRGPLVPFVFDSSPAGKRRGEERRLRVERALEELCRQLHAGFMGRQPGRTLGDELRERQRDTIHATEETHATRGALEGEALIAAWTSIHPTLEPAPPGHDAPSAHLHRRARTPTP